MQGEQPIGIAPDRAWLKSGLFRDLLKARNGIFVAILSLDGLARLKGK